MNCLAASRQFLLKARAPLLVSALIWLAACIHTERLTRAMTHLQGGQTREVTVGFEIQCKHRSFALIRIRSVDGVSVQTNSTNMLSEIDDFIPGKDAGPFPYSCRY
jgi:hypothetical protein